MCQLAADIVIEDFPPMRILFNAVENILDGGDKTEFQVFLTAA
jgi:hypothetical protein